MLQFAAHPIPGFSKFVQRTADVYDRGYEGKALGDEDDIALRAHALDARLGTREPLEDLAAVFLDELVGVQEFDRMTGIFKDRLFRHVFDLHGS